jgi:spoIIIJ-associated protein
MIKDQTKKIKDITQEFFDEMGEDVEVEVKKQQDSTIPIEIKTMEPKMLIGQSGSNLVDIQRILKLILRKRLDKGVSLEADLGQSEQPAQFYIDLDINNYKKKKIEYLKELAKTVADEVSLSGEEKVIGPLPAYERRIIHLELEDRENISCESIGEEPERSVVIKLKT